MIFQNIMSRVLQRSAKLSITSFNSGLKNLNRSFWGFALEMSIQQVGRDTGRNAFKQPTKTIEGGVLLSRGVIELTELQDCIETRQAAHYKSSGVVQIARSLFKQPPIKQRLLAEGVKRFSATKDRARALDVSVALVSGSKTRPEYGIVGVQRDS